MRTGKKLTAEILSGKWDEALKKLYMDNQKIQQQKKRYVKAVASYCEIFGEMPVEIYSAPGRSEVGGNHTDHQHGRVLAASVSLMPLQLQAGWMSRWCGYSQKDTSCVKFGWTNWIRKRAKREQLKD